MKIYFAAPFTRGPFVARLHETVREIGHEPTSRWCLESNGKPDKLSTMSLVNRARHLAENDADIAAADILVAIVVRGLGKEMFAEATLARLLDKPIYWVGDEDDMPLSAFRVGSLVIPGTALLLETLREVTGPHGLDRVRCSMRQV